MPNAADVPDTTKGKARRPSSSSWIFGHGPFGSWCDRAGEVIAYLRPIGLSTGKTDGSPAPPARKGAQPPTPWADAGSDAWEAVHLISPYFSGSGQSVSATASDDLVSVTVGGWPAPAI